VLLAVQGQRAGERVDRGTRDVQGQAEVLDVVRLCPAQRGRHADFLAHVAVKDTQALRDLVLALAKRQEIADIRSSVVFEHHRRTTIMPLPDR